MKPDNIISFVHDGRITSVDFSEDKLKTTTTVLNYLRDSPCHKGTKEGCAEGDCGACTVVIGELDAENNFKYTAVDSCLVFLPMLHGKWLITVEDVAEKKTHDETLHPVQQSMVDENGSQCGFCTPGFIMSLFALYKNENNPSKEKIDDALTGNLCRCTGYKSIVTAAAKACVHPHSDQFNEKEKEIRKLILKIREEKSSLHIQTEQQHYFQPGSLEEAMLIKSKNPEALLINGATDISLLVTKKHQVLPGLIDLSAITELKQYKKYDGSVFIGAGMNMEDIRVKLENEFPALSGMLNVFGSRQIRSLATLGGNVGSASPISDTIPVLIAYDAVVHLQSIHGKRKFNMNEFITGYRRTKINADELITGITIPLPGKNSIHKSYKISKRKDLDISTVNAGFMLQIENKKITSCILAYGGMAAKTMRAENAEKFLDGKSWNRETATEASEIIYNEFSPISDARSGAEFRKLAARNLLIKFWSETTENGKR